MPTPATFPDLIAARDVGFTDDTYYAPGSVTCPNGDDATIGNGTPGAAAYRDDTPGDFMLPWGTNDWSFECWLYKVSASVTNPDFVIYGDTTLTSGGYRWRIVGNGTDVILIIYNGVSTIIAQYNISYPTAGTWAHYVWTVNSSLGTGAAAGRRIKGYKNGASAGSDVAFTASFTNTTPSNARLWLPRTTDTDWEMAKFAIYHRELDATDVSDHYLLMTT